MKTKYVNYDHCITNVTSSILKYYHLKPFYKTNEILDSYLAQKNYDNVIIFIFDGMGEAILNKNTSCNHFLQKHKVDVFDSTFPPTTANCTTAFLSGKNPIETGWFGWSTYFSDLNMVIDNYPNCETISKQLITGENIAENKLNYQALGEIIENSQQNVKYYSVFPSFKPNGCKSLKEFEHRICKICNEPGKKYIYAYWDEPDKSMHRLGTKNDVIKKILNQIGKTIKNIERKTKNTIGIVCADHGQIDVVPIALYTYYDIMSCLSVPFSCDSRTAFFFIKDGKKEEFANLFNQYFKDYFDLYTKQEALNLNLFGVSNDTKYQNLIGDFIAVAKDKYYFMQSTNAHIFNGAHAGGCQDEIKIPLIIFNN